MNSTALLLLLPASLWAQFLWQTPPADTLDHWRCGPGGCASSPAPPFQLVKEEGGGSTPKVEVRDANRRTWSVKFGAEVIPECFGSRFVTAVGYFVEPSYFVAVGKLQGVGRLKRARRVVGRDGSFRRGRFQERGAHGLEFLPGKTWSWNNATFPDHQLGGLKVLMMLLSNWDAKDTREGDDSNNAIFRVGEGDRSRLVYSVFDWGASLGRWGKILRRDQSDCAGFTRDTQAFVRAGDGGVLIWGFNGKHADDLKNVTMDDVRWLLPWLERLNPEHMTAGLTASGATERQARCWSAAIQKRIADLKAVAQALPPAR